MATTIKVDRVVLMDALKSRLAEQDKFRAEYKKAEDKYEKDNAKFAEKVVALAKQGKLEVKNTCFRHWNNTLEIEFVVDKAVIPASPDRPDRPAGMYHDSDYEELGRTIKLLGMTNEQSVSASVYKSVSQWL